MIGQNDSVVGPLREKKKKLEEEDFCLFPGFNNEVEKVDLVSTEKSQIFDRKMFEW